MRTLHATGLTTADGSEGVIAAGEAAADLDATLGIDLQYSDGERLEDTFLHGTFVREAASLVSDRADAGDSLFGDFDLEGPIVDQIRAMYPTIPPALVDTMKAAVEAMGVQLIQANFRLAETEVDTVSNCGRESDKVFASIERLVKRILVDSGVNFHAMETEIRTAFAKLRTNHKVVGLVGGAVWIVLAALAYVFAEPSSTAGTIGWVGGTFWGGALAGGTVGHLVASVFPKKVENIGVDAFEPEVPGLPEAADPQDLIEVCLNLLAVSEVEAFVRTNMGKGSLAEYIENDAPDTANSPANKKLALLLEAARLSGESASQAIRTLVKVGVNRAADGKIASL